MSRLITMAPPAGARAAFTTKIPIAGGEPGAIGPPDVAGRPALEDRELVRLAVDDEQDYPLFAIDLTEDGLDLRDGRTGLQQVGEQDPPVEMWRPGPWRIGGRQRLVVHPQPPSIEAGGREDVALEAERNRRDWQTR